MVAAGRLDAGFGGRHNSGITGRHNTGNSGRHGADFTPRKRGFLSVAHPKTSSALGLLH